MEPYLAVIYGGGGAIVPDVLKVINGRFGDAPDWVGKQHYWVGALLLVILGAVVAYFSNPTRAVDALALGYAAPAIVAGLLGTPRTEMPPKKDQVDVSKIDQVEISKKDGSNGGAIGKPLGELIRGVRAGWGVRYAVL